MKFNPNVSSARRKSRKAHFGASSGEKRKRMSCALHKDLRDQYKVRSLPVRKDDEVEIVRGLQAGRSGKVISVGFGG